MNKISCQRRKSRKTSADIVIEHISKYPDQKHDDDQDREGDGIQDTENAQNDIVSVLIDIVNGIQANNNGINTSG